MHSKEVEYSLALQMFGRLQWVVKVPTKGSISPVISPKIKALKTRLLNWRLCLLNCFVRDLNAYTIMYLNSVCYVDKPM